MSSDSLNQSVAAFARPVEYLTTESSLERAAEVLRRSYAPMVPVRNGSSVVGVVTERGLAAALANGCEPFAPVEEALVREFPTISSFETGAEALRRLSDGADAALLVLDSGDRVLGVVAASDLYPKTPYVPRPPSVGGMATPFGVYLTSGGIGAGASPWALASTGAVMFLLVAAGYLVEYPLVKWAAGYGYGSQFGAFWDSFPVLFLFGGMRILPLSGIHAAEHKVVHAIERGEALVPEVVDRMPRVHPRCGTNLWAGATIFILIFQFAPFVQSEVRLLLAAIATFLFWKPVGSAMQFLVTTKPPNRKQVEMGIRSAKELLEKYQLNRNSSPNPFQRIWNSGMLHVMAGFFACDLILYVISLRFKFDLPF